MSRFFFSLGWRRFAQLLKGSFIFRIGPGVGVDQEPGTAPPRLCNPWRDVIYEFRTWCSSWISNTDGARKTNLCLQNWQHSFQLFKPGINCKQLFFTCCWKLVEECHSLSDKFIKESNNSFLTQCSDLKKAKQIVSHIFNNTQDQGWQGVAKNGFYHWF